MRISDWSSDVCSSDLCARLSASSVSTSGSATMRPRRKPSGRWSRSGMRQPKAMTEVRDNIDRLDRQIVALLAERTGYVRQAARVKLERGAIVDPERIEDVVAKVRKQIGRPSGRERVCEDV